MAGQIKVDSINADSNLALKIANTAVAFIDSSGLRPVSGNVNLDATATSKVFLPSANTVEIQTAGVTGLSMSSSQVVTLANALPVGSGGTGNTATPTAGGIIYGTGTVQAVTAAGTSGQPIVSGGAGAPAFRPYTLPASDGSASQVLQTNGSGALSFATLSAGALTFLSTVTASASATVDIETTFNATYDNYFLVISELVAATTGATLKCLLKLGGVYDTSASYSYYYGSGSAGSATLTAAGAAGATSIILVGAQQPIAGRSLSLQMYITNVSSTTLTKGITHNACSWDNISGLQATNGASSSLVLTAMTGIRFFMSSGNITSGKFRLYGIANS